MFRGNITNGASERGLQYIGGYVILHIASYINNNIKNPEKLELKQSSW